MKISQVKQAVAISHKAHRPVFLWGQPGIGKSDAIAQAAGQIAGSMDHVVNYHDVGRVEITSQSFGLHDVRLSQCEPVDVRGLPVPDVDEGTTQWLPPDWLPHVGRDDLPEQGILFLDEANAAPQSVLAAAYQITLDRRIGNFALKDGWSIVLAGNRMTDGGVTFKMPRPLANRLIHLNVELDVDEWTAWAVDNNVPVEVVAFIRFRPDLLNTFEEHVKQKREGEAFATPRSWHAVCDVLSANPPFDVMMDMLNGAVGAGPAAEFMGFMQVWQKMPNIDGIMIDPMGAPVPEDAATLFAVSAALANRATPDNMDNIVQYIDRVPPEFAVLTIKDAQRRTPQVLTTAAFTRWANKNAGLWK